MAHDVVIAGGGFAGANAARELERILPRQSTRLILVNDVNFLLYTPLLPEAAAGMLEPRHVVTPLRDMLNRYATSVPDTNVQMYGFFRSSCTGIGVSSARTISLAAISLTIRCASGATNSPAR